MNQFNMLGKHIGEIDSLVNDWIARLGLTYNHFAVLYSLANAAGEPCSQKQIGEEWYLPKQTVSNICKQYREQGWIECHDSPQDKRERILYLTEAGKAEAEPVLQATQAVFDKAFKAFGKTKTAQLFALMEEFSQTCRRQF